MKDVELKADWLAESFKSAEISVMSKHTSIDFVSMGGKVNLPISKEKADCLYHKLNSIFMSWTGTSLNNYKV